MSRLVRFHKVGGVEVLAMVAALCIASAQAEVIDGRVNKVIDGDTLDVVSMDNKRLRVRLGGIDAPETDQPFGRISGRNLRYLALRRPITVRSYKLDTNGRTVGQAWVAAPAACPDAKATCERTLDLGAAQLRVGLAWHYKHYESEQNTETRTRYADEEQKARARRVGLWSSRRPVPPWEWRHGTHRQRRRR